MTTNTEFASYMVQNRDTHMWYAVRGMADSSNRARRFATVDEARSFADNVRSLGYRVDVMGLRLDLFTISTVP